MYFFKKLYIHVYIYICTHIFAHISISHIHDRGNKPQRIANMLLPPCEPSDFKEMSTKPFLPECFREGKNASESHLLS